MSTSLFPEWESTWPELPARTRLFNLEPIGLGTPYVECLTSYIAREAGEHQVPPWFIVSKDIAPRMTRKSLAEQSGHSDLYGKMGASLNGMCSTSTEVVRIMEELTGRTGLAELTMQHWAGVLAPTALVRRYQAWCPICLEEWNLKRKPVYVPLLWASREAELCMDHFVPLAMECPKCKKVHGPVTWYSTPGYCPYCRSWLGYNSFKTSGQNAEGLKSVIEWRRFKSLGVGHLVSVRPERIPANVPAVFSQNIRILFDRVFRGNASEFERVLHHSRLTLKRWVSGEQLPQLLSVLYLAYRLKMLPQDFLLEKLTGDKSFQILPSQDQVTKRVKRQKRKRDREGIRNYLQLTLNANIDPPLSFRRICVRAQIDQGRMAKEFPELATQLMNRYKLYVDERSAKRRASIVAALFKGISEIHAKGEFPTLRRMRKALENPNWLIEKWARDERKRIIIGEMGFRRRGLTDCTAQKQDVNKLNDKPRLTPDRSSKASKKTTEQAKKLLNRE